eukprot:gb/GEZN01003412.1/.p1 GENE.gb/GEZN01003412.1/~~gb/GEZN01003412.1/.p1  ORF type:complete len:344 (+),score=27.87 gb/GEZN01003412.1/:1089-2120(+)
MVGFESAPPAPSGAEHFSGQPYQLIPPEPESGGVGGTVPIPSVSNGSSSSLNHARPRGFNSSSVRRQDSRAMPASPKQAMPIFIYSMVFVNIVVFVLEIYNNGWELEDWSTNPMMGPDPQVLLDMGAKQGDLIVQDGQWWRLFCPIWLHAGLLHLGFNMYALLQLGRDFERHIGSVRIALIYVISGVNGLLWSCLFIPQIIGIGASGAIYGLLGALLGDFVLHSQYMASGRCKYLRQLLLTTVIGIIIGLLPLVDNFAHLGGWFAGFVSSLAILTGTITNPWTGKRVCTLAGLPAVVALAVLIFNFMIALSLVYSEVDGSDPCPVCDMINCVETPWWTCDHLY